MKKKTLLVLASVMTVAMLAGCTKTSTKTVTTSTTDANGNTVTETTQTQTVNGETTKTTEVTENNKTTTTVESADETEVVDVYEKVPMDIENQLGGAIYELRITMSSVDEWGDNLVADGGCIENGDTASGLNLTYSSDDYLFDVLAVDAEGTELTFEEIDPTPCNGEAFTLVLEYDENDDEFYAYIK